MRKVAIVGGADTTKGDAPFHDESWEIWGMPWIFLPRAEKYFEPHDNWDELGAYPNGNRRESIVEWLNDCGSTIYMDKVEPDVERSVPIDWDGVKALRKVTSHDEPYIESTIGLMLAYAVMELSEGDRVGIWGVDLDIDSEYAYQRPNAEYWIGRLEGMGVKVFIPPRSGLLSSEWPDLGRYGKSKP